jgi:hypothetical protein
VKDRAAATWGRNLAFFYLSFFSAGTQGVVTQLFLREHYPESKELLLPVVLILGALAYLLGIRAAARRPEAPVAVLRIMLLANAGGFALILVARSLAAYVLLYCASCFACNFAYNYLDRRAVHSSRSRLDPHVKSLLAYQVLAFVFSPLFFAFGRRLPIPMALAVPVIALVTCLPAVLSFGQGSSSAPKLSEEARKDAMYHLSRSDKIFVAYVLVFLAAVSIAVSMMAFLVSEYYRIEDYAEKSSIVLASMSAAAAAAILILRRPSSARPPTGCARPDKKEPRFRIGLHATIMLTSLAMATLLTARLSLRFSYVLAPCAVLGFMYGLFLNSTRSFAAAASAQAGKQGLLSVYNSLQSLASLAGYVATFLSWLLASKAGGQFYFVVMASIVALLALDLLLIFMWIGSSRRSEGRAAPIEA